MRQSSPKVFHIGPFRLDVNERTLLREGDVIPLLGKAFDTLVALAERAGTLQEQQALIDRIWPNVVVEPNSLQQNISLIRRALAGVPDVKIETVRGRGYRLVAEVRELSTPAQASPRHDAVLPAQRTHFCRAHDGTRLAYALLGNGRPFIKVANWLSHLELDLTSPIWRHWLRLMSRDRRLVRYDARGTGLSEWRPPAISFEDFIEDLGTVLDAAHVERAPVLGISQGAAVAVAYAARHPERVSALILVGGTARGWRIKNHPRLTERMEALMTLMRLGWGSPHAAFRQIFSSSFLPRGSAEEIAWFNDLQRDSTTPENAAAILSALGDVDVREEATRVRVPTLVVHARGDLVVPIKDGIELATHIEGARFVPLESDNHLLLADEPAWTRFVQEFERFLSELDSP